jgi:hypothetical protein
LVSLWNRYSITVNQVMVATVKLHPYFVWTTVQAVMMVFSLKTEQNKDNSRNIWNMDFVIYLLIIIT